MLVAIERWSLMLYETMGDKFEEEVKRTYSVI